MPELKVLLIAGRSLKQGTGDNLGKGSQEYRDATSTVELCALDMDRLGVSDGDPVEISTSTGQVEVRCRHADLPAGMAFIAYGPRSSALMGSETHASGMPDSKAIEVAIRPASQGGVHEN